MHKLDVANVLGMLVLSLVLAACGGAYTESGSKTTSHQNMAGGDVTVEISKANGTIEKDIEGVAANPDTELEVDVTLAVGKGTYKIELLGKDKQVTITLEARDGETVSGHGQMVTDSFGDASYRVTAVDAENVDYVLEYGLQ
jgi:ABC-type enterochelin transport system substrate-binding protein